VRAPVLSQDPVNQRTRDRRLRSASRSVPCRVRSGTPSAGRPGNPTARCRPPSTGTCGPATPCSRRHPPRREAVGRSPARRADRVVAGERPRLDERRVVVRLPRAGHLRPLPYVAADDLQAPAPPREGDLEAVVHLLVPSVVQVEVDLVLALVLVALEHDTVVDAVDLHVRRPVLVDAIVRRAWGRHASWTYTALSLASRSLVCSRSGLRYARRNGTYPSDGLFGSLRTTYSVLKPPFGYRVVVDPTSRGCFTGTPPAVRAPRAIRARGSTSCRPRTSASETA